MRLKLAQWSTMINLVGGTVIGYEGNENDLRIEIKFQNHGIKMLAMEYAKLTKV